jgi:hypothetical protein
MVMGASRDPVGAGFTASLARPGGNITGLTSETGLQIVGKYFELIKEVVPNVSLAALSLNPIPPGAANYRKAAEIAAKNPGVSLSVVEARGRDELEDAFAAMAAGSARSRLGPAVIRTARPPDGRFRGVAAGSVAGSVVDRFGMFLQRMLDSGSPRRHR